MAKISFRKLISFFLCSICSTTYGDEDINAPPAEYVQIFQNIPALFEYLLDVIEHRPEILESNDITIINRYFDEGPEPREKRSYAVEIRNKNNMGRSDSKRLRVTDVADAIATEHDGSNIAIQSIDGFRIKDLSKRDEDKDSMDFESLNDAGKLCKSKDLDANELKISKSFDDASLRLGNLLTLDYEPEDVVKHIIRINELLEEHNIKSIE